MTYNNFDFQRWQNLLIKKISEKYKISIEEATKIAESQNYQQLFEPFKYLVSHEAIEKLACHAWHKYHHIVASAPEVDEDEI